MVPSLRIKTSNGPIITVPYDLLQSQSPVFHEMVKHNKKNGRESRPIYLEKVDSRSLSLVMQWAAHHKDDLIVPVSSALPTKLFELLTPWDHEFSETLTFTELFELVGVAEFFDIPKLSDLGIHRLIVMARGKSSREIREMMRMPDEWDDVIPNNLLWVFNFADEKWKAMDEQMRLQNNNNQQQ